MSLQNHFESAGKWLFRWRSYIPFCLLIPFLIEMRNFDWPMHNHEFQFGWELCCIAVSFAGLAVRCLTVGYAPSGTSGRNTLSQVANVLNTTGMYSIVRHPLYLGNFLIWLGIASFCLDWRLLLIFLLAFWLYYERIMVAEEAFLRERFGADFEAWAAKTPAFVPWPSHWISPTQSYSLRTVLRREYSGFFGVIMMFFGLDTLCDGMVEGQLVFERFYLVMGAVGAAIYLTLRTLKKQTRWLQLDA